MLGLKLKARSHGTYRRYLERLEAHLTSGASATGARVPGPDVGPYLQS